MLTKFIYIRLQPMKSACQSFRFLFQTILRKIIMGQTIFVDGHFVEKEDANVNVYDYSL